MRLVALCLLLLVAGCDRPPFAEDRVNSLPPAPTEDALRQRQLMTGKWLGRATTKEGYQRRWLSERRNDGSYRITFDTTPAGQAARRQVEVGLWGVSGDVYFTIYLGVEEPDGEVLPSNPADPRNYDAYRIVELTPTRMVYRHASYGDVYTIEKVDDQYELWPSSGT